MNYNVVELQVMCLFVLGDIFLVCYFLEFGIDNVLFYYVFKIIYSNVNDLLVYVELCCLMFDSEFSGVVVNSGLKVFSFIVNMCQFDGQFIQYDIYEGLLGVMLWLFNGLDGIENIEVILVIFIQQVFVIGDFMVCD